MQFHNDFIRALQSRNFRIYWLGMSASQIGNWIQHVAIGWVAYRLTESTSALGLLSLSGNIGILVLAPFAGVWVDRLDRRKLIYLTQSLFLLEALILALLSFMEGIQFWHLVTLSLTMSVVAALDMPLRQTLVSDMVNDKALLANAVALNSLSFNLARIIGPAIGGYMLSWDFESTLFSLNALSCLMVMLSLLYLQWQPQKMASLADKPDFWPNFCDGVQYACRFLPITSLLLILCMTGLTLAPFSTLIPAIVHQLYDGNSIMAGQMYGGIGLGAIIAMIYLAGRKSVLGLDKGIVIAILSASLALIVLASTKIYWISLLLTPIIGAGIMTNLVSCNSLLQTLLGDDKRGRIMGLFVMVSVGTYPLGALAIGFVSNHIGLKQALVIAGGLGMLAGLVFFYHLPRIRTASKPIFKSIDLQP